MLDRMIGTSGFYRTAARNPMPPKPYAWATRCKLWARAMLVLLLLPCGQAAAADVADAVMGIKPAVVGVGTYRPTGAPQASLEGTGFAVGNGLYIVTCAHVVSKPLDYAHNESWAIFYRQGDRTAYRLAQMAGVDKEHDLAVLKIPGPPLPTLALGDSKDAREGWTFYFTGFPIGALLGLYPATARAGLSAIVPIFTPVLRASELTARAIQAAAHPYRIFQLDGIAYPGNSGSPLWFPEDGKVYGVVNAVYVKGSKEAALSHPTGISYAIPSDYVIKLLQKVGVPGY